VPRVVGGRYGLGLEGIHARHGAGGLLTSKARSPGNHFTVGILDDVSANLRCPTTPTSIIEAADVRRCVFVGLGADGTVGANKNSIKIIGEQTDNFAQGYFVYDSKKSGSMTTSHLRFGPRPMRAPVSDSPGRFRGVQPVSVSSAAPTCSGFAAPGATVLLNSPYTAGADVGQTAARVAGDAHRKEASSST